MNKKPRPSQEFAYNHPWIPFRVVSLWFYDRDVHSPPRFSQVQPISRRRTYLAERLRRRKLTIGNRRGTSLYPFRPIVVKLVALYWCAYSKKRYGRIVQELRSSLGKNGDDRVREFLSSYLLMKATHRKSAAVAYHFVRNKLYNQGTIVYTKYSNFSLN